MAALDKKYRINKLSKFIGNEDIIEVIEIFFDNLLFFPATILLQGPSGCGKTTLARIIAKMLKKQIYELNVADARKIEDARGIIQNLKFQAMNTTGKVIILNECHEAVKQFQDAMLEVLEEPPEGTHFILCTTNPEKLLDTIKTRCTILTVRKLSMDEMKSLIKYVCKKEKKRLDKSVIKKLVIAADGTPRNALTILNAIINVDSKSKQKKLIESFDIMESPNVRQLCQVLLKGSSYSNTMKLVDKIDEDAENVRRMILGHMARVLINEDNPRAALIINNFWESFYYVGKPGLVSCVYNTINEGE